MTKKVIGLMIVALLLFSLVACNRPDDVNFGVFYNLQEAYDIGFLNEQDLMSIAYYHGSLDSVGGTFVPTPKEPEILSPEIEKSIKETRASTLRVETYSDGTLKQPEATVSDVMIIGYFGKYSDSFAIMLQDSYYDYMDEERSVDIAGVTFNYSNSNSILIWRDNKMDLERLAKQSYLDTFLKENYPESTLKDVTFRPYLGIYNNSLVAVFYGGKYHGDFPDVEISYVIEELEFVFSEGYPILVWNRGNVYELPHAYEQGFLIKENLIMIYNIYYNR